MSASGKDNKAKSEKRVLAREEKLGSTVREPSTHMRKASKQSSENAHSGCRGTHGLEGAWGVALEGKISQCGESLSYIGTRALGSKFLIGVQQGFLRH